MNNQIDSIDKFKAACTNKYQDFILKLNGGVYSRKECSYDPIENIFFILNCIDGTTQYLTPAELFTKSNIGHAIIVGAFYEKHFT